MSNSKLATVHYWTDNYSSRGGAKISKIIIHHMAGNLDAKGCYNVWKKRRGSAHYAISSSGQIGQLIDEKYRAWSVANEDADSVAVTMELANDGGSPDWHVSDKAIAAAIKLCADICKRNGISKLNFTGNTSGNLVMHCYYMATACPGPYLKGKFKYIADEVNKILAGDTPAPEPKSWADYKLPFLVKVECDDLYIRKGPGIKNYGRQTVDGSEFIKPGTYTIVDEEDAEGYSWGKLKSSTAKSPRWTALDYTTFVKEVDPEPVQIYRIRKTWEDTKSQVGAYKILANARKKCDEYPGYSVFDNEGKAVYTSKQPTLIDELFKACKEQTSWAYASKYEWQGKPTVAKSKLKGTCVTYVACVLQRIGVLKSGQYIWHNGRGYGDGKVYGTNDRMQVIYTGNKRPADLKNVLKPGDIVMIDDNKSGHRGDGGHTEIFSGVIQKDGKAVYYSGGLGSGHNTTNANKDKRPVLAIVRIRA